MNEVNTSPCNNQVTGLAAAGAPMQTTLRKNAMNVNARTDRVIACSLRILRRDRRLQVHIHRFDRAQMHAASWSSGELGEQRGVFRAPLPRVWTVTGEYAGAREEATLRRAGSRSPVR